MKVTWLAWYVCGVLALMALVASAITCAPPAQWAGVVFPVAFGTGAILAAVGAPVLSSLPADHWVRHSRRLWAALVAAAITLTLLLALVG
jgi:hypothetical protein